MGKIIIGSSSIEAQTIVSNTGRLFLSSYSLSLPFIVISALYLPGLYRHPHYIYYFKRFSYPHAGQIQSGFDCDSQLFHPTAEYQYQLSSRLLSYWSSPCSRVPEVTQYSYQLIPALIVIYWIIDHWILHCFSIIGYFSCCITLSSVNGSIE